MNLIKTIREKIFGDAADASSESFQEKWIITIFALGTGIIAGLFILFIWFRIYPKLILINEAKQQIEMHLQAAIKDHIDSHKVIPQNILAREPELQPAPSVYKKPKIKPIEGILESERARPKNEDNQTGDDSDGDTTSDPNKQEDNPEEKKIF